MPLAKPLNRRLIEDRVKEHSAAGRALNALVQAGCRREPLLIILAGGIPSLRSWSHFQQSLAPSPKRLRALAKRLEHTSDALEAATQFTIYLPLLALRANSQNSIREMRSLSSGFRKIASSSLLRMARKRSSYRKMGRIFKIALLCHYVKSRTRRPYFREITDLLSAANQKTLAEDAVRHRARRAVALLTQDGRYPQLLHLLTEVIATPQK